MVPLIVDDAVAILGRKHKFWSKSLIFPLIVLVNYMRDTENLFEKKCSWCPEVDSIKYIPDRLVSIIYYI